MQHFVGTYECKADDKGRIMLPISLKKQLSDKLKNGFVIKRAVFNQCLELYPYKEWDSLMERINNLNRFCLLYTSPSPRDRTRSRMPSSA